MIGCLSVFFLINLLKRHPQYLEAYYSQKIYPFIFKISHWLFGVIPFSVGDILILALILLLPLVVYKVFLFIKKKKFTPLLINSISIFFSVYIVFHITWGLNYHRITLNKKLGYDLQYSVEQLESTTLDIIQRINKLHSSLTINDTLAVEIPFTQSEIEKLLTQSKLYDMEGIFPGSVQNNLYVKKSFWSLLLSYMGFAGYVNPITLEAQVNSLMPSLSYITTAAHEMSHQLGIAAENEANFIAFRATVSHPNRYFQYAGYLFGLRYTIGEYFINRPEEARELYGEVNLGIKKNIRQISEFWEGFENPFEVIFKRGYDQYLKAQGQRDGIETYSQMVAYLVDYHTDRTD